MKTDTKHHYEPFFNLSDTNGRYNIGNIIIHGVKLGKVTQFKPDKRLKNPLWFIQKIVNW